TFGPGGDVSLAEARPAGAPQARDHTRQPTPERAEGGEILIRLGPGALRRRDGGEGAQGQAPVRLRPSFAQAHNLRNLLAAVAAEIGAGFGKEAIAVPEARAAAEALPGLLRAGDTVLVKGSRGVGLELIAEVLRGAGRAGDHGEAPLGGLVAGPRSR